MDGRPADKTLILEPDSFNSTIRWLTMPSQHSATMTRPTRCSHRAVIGPARSDQYTLIHAPNQPNAAPIVTSMGQCAPTTHRETAMSVAAFARAAAVA